MNLLFCIKKSNPRHKPYPETHPYTHTIDVYNGGSILITTNQDLAHAIQDKMNFSITVRMMTNWNYSKFKTCPQVTIATTMMFCHRFYMRQSHMKNDWQAMLLECSVLSPLEWL